MLQPPTRLFLLRSSSSLRVLPPAIMACSAVGRRGLAAAAAAASKSKAPGSDPLLVLQKESLARSLCDETGGRLPGTHWVACISIARTLPDKVRRFIAPPW